MNVTSVTPAGRFIYGIHKPHYRVKNLRKEKHFFTLGHFADGTSHENQNNFQKGDVTVENGKWIYEIANPFFFRGTTFIDSVRADWSRANVDQIRLPSPPSCSLREVLRDETDSKTASKILSRLPVSMLYGLAATSTDAEELVLLASRCCQFEMDSKGNPKGMRYTRDARGRIRANIQDLDLFETIANNLYLPDEYKRVMVLIPGVQGDSEIVGDFTGNDSHVFEYLRSNSYIPWGHYASNTAHDQVRYRTSDLSVEDMTALRHLYYQRIFVILAEELDCPMVGENQTISEEDLEKLRLQLVEKISKHTAEQKSTLWGWNFGYDFSASGYRLHASHQQIHQQFAMVPETVDSYYSQKEPQGTMNSFGCGDLIATHLDLYHQETGSIFFEDYIAAIRSNQRMDGCDGESSLIVFCDDNVMLYVPKAQVSQWELQLMVTADCDTGPVGNIVEADSGVRRSLDQGILMAQQIFAALGARMVTSIEYSKRFGVDNGQRLLYSFLPKLPWAMGAFSEAQLRFICGHYPEDFAIACRMSLVKK